MEPLGHIRAAAFLSIGRACMFGALAIWAMTFGFIAWPVTAFRVGALLTTLAGVILVYKALAAPYRSYRRTETWMLIGRNHGLPEEHAQAVISGILRETFWRFALYASVVALLLWIAAAMSWLVTPAP